MYCVFTSSPPHPAIQQVTNERNALQAENAKLKEEMSRLRYRVNHLVKELNAMEAA